MKKIWTMMAMVLVFAGCSQEDTDSPINVYSLTGYANVESRTAFGTPGTTSIPFQWSVGDKIYVGDNESNTITTGGSSATFTFSKKLSETDVYYNMTASNSSFNQANVLTTQTVGNLGANGDFGYATIDNNSFTLKHATSYVWFDTTLPQGATLESITLNAGTTTIAGTATWDGIKFGEISNASSSITLSVNKSSVSGAELAMVIFPVTFNEVSVTYQLRIEGTTKYYTKTISGNKQILAGKTWKISTNLTNVDLYELRVLTFEDDDKQFEEYGFNGGDGEYYEITTWSDLIPEYQYFNGSPLIYFMYEDAAYEWYDQNNTELHHVFPYNYGIQNYPGGGAVISSHTVELDDMEENSIYDYQISVTCGSGNNGSDNFCVAYNVSEVDPENSGLEKTTLVFGDGKAHVIDHMYVTIVAPTHYCIKYGNSFSQAYDDDDFLKLIATGIKEDDSETEPIEILLAEGSDYLITDWTKWDLSGLGEVVGVKFHMEEAQFDTYSGVSYYRTPLYFAIDDIAVRF